MPAPTQHAPFLVARQYTSPPLCFREELPSLRMREAERIASCTATSSVARHAHLCRRESHTRMRFIDSSPRLARRQTAL